MSQTKNGKQNERERERSNNINYFGGHSKQIRRDIIYVETKISRIGLQFSGTSQRSTNFMSIIGSFSQLAAYLFRGDAHCLQPTPFGVRPPH